MHGRSISNKERGSKTPSKAMGTIYYYYFIFNKIVRLNPRPKIKFQIEVMLVMLIVNT